YYDSLVGKLIVHGKTRGECLMRLKRALDEFVIDGIETTLPLFRALVREKDVIDGDYHIRWLEEFLARGGMEGERASRAGAAARPLPATVAFATSPIEDFDAQVRRECGWHANLSRGTLAHLIFGTHPAAGSTAWPTAKPRSSRSRRRSCSRPMPAASFP